MMPYPYRILILEDHHLQRQHMQDTLLEAGFSSVDAVSNGHQALRAISKNKYHLILLDLDMPDMDGMQFIQELSCSHPTLLLSIVSACTRSIMESAGFMARSKKMTVINCYAKPFSLANAHDMGTKMRMHYKYKQQGTKETDQSVPTMNAEILHSAFLSAQIQPWFQPKLALSSREIAGVEVLARWLHPEKGLISPSTFLPAVTSHNLDRHLLLHMLESALKSHLRWKEQGYLVPLSINMPPHLLDDPELPDLLMEHVKRQNVSPQLITFELLETSLPIDNSQLFMGAGRLRLKGFLLAQDDFGIGYSSMQTLTSVPFTELKIDRSFVSGVATDVNRAAAVRSSILLGKQLGLTVTAEGVESNRDLEFLQRSDCDYIQGFLISRPLPDAEFLDFLKNIPYLSTP